ncbi:MAG: type II secretion system inner membrane protein GspF [Terrimicrobiaceae bacterium]
MATFTYRAMEAGGRIAIGEVTASSRTEAYRLLRDRGLRPSEVLEAGSPPSRKAARDEHPSAPVHISRLSSKDLLFFTEELADLLEAGLQLENALKVIASRGEESPVKAVATDLRQRVRDGVSFSKSLRDCGAAFDPLYCNMVAAGEAAGALPKILRSQCAHLTLISDLRNRVTSALVYPSIVFVAAILLMFIFLTVLVPQLSVLLGKTGQKLPLVTQVLIAVSEFCGRWWWALLAGGGAITLLARAGVNTPAGKAWWHRAALDIPVVGPVLRSRFYAEMLQTLSTLVSNGVTLLQGLHLLFGATSNVFLRSLLERAAALVGEGSSLANALRRIGFFPQVLCDILAVGEQTGDIAGALERAARRYDRELTSRIERLTTLIQPAIILIVALFVGVVAYSMIAGILTSVNSLRPK